MRQVRAIIEIPRDYAYSKLCEYQYIYSVNVQYNFNLVLEMFLGIDDTLVAAIMREIEK